MINGKMTEEEIQTVKNIQNQVHRAYQDILGRHADEDGLNAATKNMLNKTLTIESLRNSLIASEEYKKRNVYKELSEEYKSKLYDRIMDKIYVDRGLDILF